MFYLVVLVNEVQSLEFLKKSVCLRIAQGIPSGKFPDAAEKVQQPVI